MTEFAKTLQGFIDNMPAGPDRDDIEQALCLCPAIEVEVVTEEQANKGIRRLRTGALESGLAYIIARAGRIDNLDQAAFVISSKTLLALMGSIHDGTERKASRRRPASGLLAQLKPMGPSVVKMRLSPRAEEETTGGRGRVF